MRDQSESSAQKFGHLDLESLSKRMFLLLATHALRYFYRCKFLFACSSKQTHILNDVDKLHCKIVTDTLHVGPRKLPDE